MTRCPRCHDLYGVGPKARTRDHILPRNLGGLFVMYGDVNNQVIMCAECNQWRGTCGHCWGVVACIDAVVLDGEMTRRQVYRKWKMGVPVNELVQSGMRMPREPSNKASGMVMRRTVTADAVAIGMAVARLGIEAFEWPADTPEKVEHNYRALLRGGYKPRGL